MTFLHRVVAGNEVWTWFVALGICVAIFTSLRLAKWAIHRRLLAREQRAPSEVTRLMADLVRRTQVLFLFTISLFVASLVLNLPPTASRGISVLAILALLIQLAMWGNRLITYWVSREIRRQLEQEKDAATATTLNAVGFLAKIALWTVVLLIALENIGVDVTALIAGLGIAGVAVALALQNVLGDLFASISIVVDKPFLVGDFIVVGDTSGTVERIGLKTTRIRSLTGEQVVLANSDLLGSRIRNYRRMRERRVAFTFRIAYDTPPELLERIPQTVREIIEGIPNTRFDRAHFKEYGDFALIFEVVYYVLVPDYSVYMDTQQAINLGLLRRFQEMGIRFAYPTQVVYIQPSPGPSKEDRHGH
ncbi:MAG TPA: mechanosensitive ion channel family protein [Candidatus Bipolaricaulis anaerobius]|jgi:small-conductance mechanosensitive channel|uniref:Small-conductance mechanosensitive channel n=1 Tax=Candidatus Bipolaricaulis anaerobius TaxID=2026885 RepID=A0A2X3K421_9BACT|nr:mechanosensitive ion channel family protein [Candidatus Bipolaricaulis anaerobius]MBP7726896.1 mechanosensitive ion channel family protein [Candidatus Bipolaricaulis sp.]MDD3748446.1 mechanosensitive ion channel family protein [Candidatus Bipolaricaulis anaerobius]MDD5764331.1 mechanosensitive ion channel family protein [Candidatus Bipolaricaulis anaerobius]SQD92027.1 Small-conductance mechanosensitive channel [Candidatus Bipolaricaulis anaerobius]HNR24591.1 mechanosensitive ion channel fam